MKSKDKCNTWLCEKLNWRGFWRVINNLWIAVWTTDEFSLAINELQQHGVKTPMIYVKGAMLYLFWCYVYAMISMSYVLQLQVIHEV